MFTYTIQPRFSETDGMGHINNTVPPVWFEEARIGVFTIFNPSLTPFQWNLIRNSPSTRHTGAANESWPPWPR